MCITSYHGSLSSEIKIFRAGSHFGSRKIALSTIGAHKFLDREEDGLPTLYEVLIEVDRDNVMSCPKDWGAPSIRGALVGVMKELERRSNDHGTEVAWRFSRYFMELDNTELELEREEKAFKFLSSECGNGIKVLSYKNVVEGDGDSLCVIDPSVIVIKEITHPKWTEIIASFKANHADGDEGSAAINRFLNGLET